jgi:uracil-DNA glycosylase
VHALGRPAAAAVAHRFSGSAPLAGTTATGFAFGGAAAARLARGGAAAAATTEVSPLPPDVTVSSQVDGEIAQCLRHLSKKDAVTKNKALQVCVGQHQHQRLAARRLGTASSIAGNQEAESDWCHG